MVSVGWKWPASRQSSLRRMMGIAEIEFVRANGAALRTDAEEFWLNGVEMVFRGERLLEDGVERGGEAFTRRLAIGGCVLESIALPAMERYGDPGEGLQSAVHFHIQGGVLD